jgi:thioester reductase-like protein
VLNLNVTPSPQGSGAHGTSKDGAPQGSATHDDGAPVLETTSAVDATAAGGGTTATTDLVARMSSSLLQTGAAATSSNDDDMLKVIMGHPCLQAPGLIPLPEPLDVAHSTLSKVRLVFQREWDELGVKQQCLMDWGSMIKVWTKSVQQKVMELRANLDKLEEVLKKEHAANGQG